MGSAMKAIFLSASVPVIGRGNYLETADPFLIQMAVRELITLALGRRLIVWGGHPAITPMVWAVCEDLGVDYADAVVLYQSRFFKELFPEENKHFKNVNFFDAAEGDREASLLLMRRAMLSRSDLEAAVFIGGMEGTLAEHSLFIELNPLAKVLAVASPGGAARQLAQTLYPLSEADVTNVDFASLFYERLGINPADARTLRGG
jgi:SLOG cluster3 family